MEFGPYTWHTDAHVCGATEVADTAFIKTWSAGQGNFGLRRAYGATPPYEAELWLVYYMSSWVVTSAGKLKEGVVVTQLAMNGNSEIDQYAELASAVQGPGVKSRFISDRGWPATNGIGFIIWKGGTIATDIVYTRFLYRKAVVRR